MRKLKKAVSFALALVMCLGLLPGTALAASDFAIRNGELTKYYGDGGAVTIPDGVTAIGTQAFFDCPNLTSVTIPSSVTAIGNNAFAYCTGLTSLVIPSSVTTIEYAAFNACTSLTSVTLSSNQTEICPSMFAHCTSLTSVTIPNGVTSIGDSAFSDCTSLKSVDLPSSLTSIGVNAFQDCTDLTNITIPSGVTQIDRWAFAGCTSLKSAAIPSGVSLISNGLFSGCTGLTSVNISHGATTIGSSFSACPNLKSVSIPSSITEIVTAAFADCANLEDVYYGGSEAQWNALNIGAANDYLFRANVHFNSAGPSTTQPTTPVQPQQPAGNATASPTNDKLEVNGSAADPTVYKIGGSNYFKIRDVAALLNGTEKQFAVGYDGTKNAVTATTGQGYDKQSGDLAGAAKGGDQSAAASNDAVYVDGQKITAEVYKINGSNYFKLRDLGKALNFYVGWSADRGMYIETDKPYSE